MGTYGCSKRVQANNSRLNCFMTQLPCNASWHDTDTMHMNMLHNSLVGIDKRGLTHTATSDRHVVCIDEADARQRP